MSTVECVSGVCEWSVRVECVSGVCEHCKLYCLSIVYEYSTFRHEWYVSTLAHSAQCMLYH
jgi:hypothetical protein